MHARVFVALVGATAGGVFLMAILFQAAASLDRAGHARGLTASSCWRSRCSPDAAWRRTRLTPQPVGGPTRLVLSRWSWDRCCSGLAFRPAGSACAPARARAAAALAGAGAVRRSAWRSGRRTLISPLHARARAPSPPTWLEHELLDAGRRPAARRSRPLASCSGPSRRADAAGAGRARRAAAPLAAPYRVLTEPVLATLLQAAALWLWHAPALFDLAL